MQQWQASRPGERIIEVDLPLSYGLCHVSQPLNPNYLNTVEIFWDPMKEVGVYVKVNCISTEFTPKKHGGEKGVPFRLQIETYIENSNNINNTNNNNSNSSSSSPINNNTNTSATIAKSPLSLQAGTSPTQTGNLTPNNSLAGHAITKQPIHAAACQIKVLKIIDIKIKLNQVDLELKTKISRNFIYYCLGYVNSGFLVLILLKNNV